MTGSVHDRRRLLALLAGAGTACALPAWSQISPVTRASRLPQDEDDEAYQPPPTIAAALDLYRRMTVPVRLNGLGPFDFVIDTGANQSVLSVELAQQLALPSSEPQLLHSVAGASITPTVAVRSLTVGDSTRENLRLSLLPAAALGGAGLLGVDRLADRRLTLDFHGRSISIEPSGKPRWSPREIVARASLRDGQLTLTKARIGRRLAVTAFIDSGADTTMGNRALQRAAATVLPGLRLKSTSVISATGQTLAGDVALLPRFHCGGLGLTNLPIFFADLHTFDLWGLNDEPAMLLGVDVLSRFERVSLDFDRREVRFRIPPSSTPIQRR